MKQFIWDLIILYFNKVHLSDDRIEQLQSILIQREIEYTEGNKYQAFYLIFKRLTTVAFKDHGLNPIKAQTGILQELKSLRKAYAPKNRGRLKIAKI